MSYVFFAIAVGTLVYFTALNLLYLAFTGIAWVEVTKHLRLRRSFAGDEAFASPLTPGISVLLPAYNEEAGIVESVRSLLALRYPRLEVVVVNDGSTDGTIARLADAFELVSVRKAIREGIATQAVRAAYVSRRDRNLSVVYVNHPNLMGFFRFSITGDSGFLAVFATVDADGRRDTQVAT